jgi:hypothetical protein
MAHFGRWIFAASLVGVALACSSGDPGSPISENPPPPATGPTFHKDVEPLLQNHCQKCHRPGGLAPFALMTYADARDMSYLMKVETAAQRMPPWGAHDTDECKPRLPWNHDARLSPAEIQTIASWHEAGAQQGDPKDAPPPRTFTDDAFHLAGKTMELKPGAGFRTTGTRDQFICFVYPQTFQPGDFITGVHVVPGNKRVVHHAVVFTDPGGAISQLANGQPYFDCGSSAQMEAGGGNMQTQGQSVTLDVWLPGADPIDLPPNIGMPITAPNSKIIMQIHYSPGGSDAPPDETIVELRHTRPAPGAGPQYLLFTTSIGNFASQFQNEGLLPGPSDPASRVEFRIPANVKDHVEKMQLTVRPPQSGGPLPDIRVYGVMAHQHLAGTDVKIELSRADGDTQCLLEDRWDFHWQRMYTYAAQVEQLPRIQVGDVLKLRCIYDNTMNNRRLSAEYNARHLRPMDITLGEETLNEMCLFIPQLLVPNPNP